MARKIKTIGLYSTLVNNDYVQYFYNWERNNKNGAGVYRIYIIDPDSAVHITLYTGSPCYIEEFVQNLIENQ